MSNIIDGGVGALSSNTLAGPPDRIIALGAIVFINSSLILLKGWISQKTFNSLNRLAISWVTWLPKSMINTKSSFISLLSF